MLSGLYLLFLQEQFRRLLNGRIKSPVVSHLFFKNSYSVIYVIYYIVFHCSNQYTLCNSLHHFVPLRRCSLCQPVIVAVGQVENAEVRKLKCGSEKKRPPIGILCLMGRHKFTPFETVTS